MTKAEIIPDDYDPTMTEHPLEGPKLSGCLLGGLLVLALAFFGIGMTLNALASSRVSAQATTQEVEIPPTGTPVIIIITATPHAPTMGATVKPQILINAVTTATNTPAPSSTAQWGAVYTWTPGAWMVTKFVKEEYAKTPTVVEPRATVEPSPSATNSRPRG